MELVSQASLLAIQAERNSAQSAASDRARLRARSEPDAKSHPVDRRADPATRRSFPVDQLDISSRADSSREEDQAVQKSSQKDEARARAESERQENISARRTVSEHTGVGRRESPLARAPERPLPPGSHLNITA